MIREGASRANNDMRPALLVIAKAPAPGRVKTRLTPPCTPQEAAALAAAALDDTLAAAAKAQLPARRVLVLEGEPGSWIPDAFEVIPQRGDGLGERLAAAFADADGPAFLVGMDTPQVTTSMLAEMGAWTLPGSPADAGKLIEMEIEKWAKVIRAGNIKPE